MGHLGTEVNIKSPKQLGIMNKKGLYDSGYYLSFEHRFLGILPSERDT